MRAAGGNTPSRWLAVVNPGRRTQAALRELLCHAHHLARARHERRTGAATEDRGPQG
ncbi:DUF6194 family protein [Streptomyces sp. NPDC085929]|uniref:DUF6194 family protein n=1 Tax=Streptomyces sp. NPDC085929 TaxID=3365739 RepID=UPI0037D850B3